MLVMGEWLLYMYKINHDLYDETLRVESAEQAGIYVLNRTDLTQASVKRGEFYDVVASEDAGVVVVVNAEKEICVMSIENGALVFIRSFVHQFPSGNLATNLMLVLGRNLFLHSWGDDPQQEERSALTVVDITTGEYVRSLNYTAQDPFSGQASIPISIVTNGVELFCGFHTPGQLLTYEPSMYHIRVYPA